MKCNRIGGGILLRIYIDRKAAAEGRAPIVIAKGAREFNGQKISCRSVSGSSFELKSDLNGPAPVIWLETYDSVITSTEGE
jgi:hypothetical protein